MIFNLLKIFHFFFCRKSGELNSHWLHVDALRLIENINGKGRVRFTAFRNKNIGITLRNHFPTSNSLLTSTFWVFSDSIRAPTKKPRPETESYKRPSIKRQFWEKKNLKCNAILGKFNMASNHCQWIKIKLMLEQYILICIKILSSRNQTWNANVSLEF